MRSIAWCLFGLLVQLVAAQPTQRWFVQADLGHLRHAGNQVFTSGFGLAGSAELQYLLGEGGWLLSLGQSFGRSYGHSTLATTTTTLDPWAAYYYRWPETKAFFPNYRFTYTSTQVMIGGQIGGRPFHRNERAWLIRFDLGWGISFVQLRADVLNPDEQPYDFDELVVEVATGGGLAFPVAEGSPAEIRAWQRANQDGRYESTYDPTRQRGGLSSFYPHVRALPDRLGLTGVFRLQPDWYLTLSGAVDGFVPSVSSGSPAAALRAFNPETLRFITFQPSGAILRVSLGAAYRLGWGRS